MRISRSFALTFRQFVYCLLAVCLFDVASCEAQKKSRYQPTFRPYYEVNLFEEDIRIIRRILDNQIQIYGANHVDLVPILNHLAVLYEQRGEWELALSVYEQSLRILENDKTANQYLLQQTLQKTAYVHRQMGHFKKAMAVSPELLETLKDDIRITEKILAVQKKTLGEEYPQVIRLKEYLASLYMRIGDYIKSAVLYEGLIEYNQRRFTGQHPKMASLWMIMGELLHKKGDIAKAIAMYEKALAIWQNALLNSHPAVAVCLTNLSILHYDLDQFDKSREYARLRQSSEIISLSHILTISSEEERLGYTSQFNPYSLLATLNDSADLANTVLKHKGIVLDSLIEDIRLTEQSLDPQRKNLISQRARIKDRLLQLQLTLNNNFDLDHRSFLEMQSQTFLQKLKDIERRLAHGTTDRNQLRVAFQANSEDIQQVLKRDSVLVEYILYQHYLGSGQFEDRYGAVLFYSDQPVKWIPLGPSEEIDDKIIAYQRLLRLSNASDYATSVLLKELYRYIWEPIDVHLGRKKKIIISPDSMINFVSFATLVTAKNKFLIEKYYIQYVATGRDLLSEHVENSDRNIVLFAHPQFARRQQKDDLFYALPGTLKESHQVIKLAKRYGYKAKSFYGQLATEDQLRRIKSPKILHLATHGFYIDQDDPTDRDDAYTVPMIEDHRQRGGHTNDLFFLNSPMQSSGFVLAGAQDTLNELSDNRYALVKSDGIVTAQEIGSLDLSKTWLVNLPACDTGLGAIQQGEGVIGLRRAFMLGGTKNLLITLWKVPDERYTPNMMKEYYKYVFRGQSPGVSLNKAQRRWLTKIRRMYGIHRAAKAVGAYILISRGIE